MRLKRNDNTQWSQGELTEYIKRAIEEQPFKLMDMVSDSLAGRIYIKTYLERDVRELAAVQELDVFRRFMVTCAARTGQNRNKSNRNRE